MPVFKLIFPVFSSLSLNTTLQLQKPTGVPLYPVESILRSFTRTAPTFLFTQVDCSANFSAISINVLSQ